MQSLANKWILITGASSGLGLEMAKRLATHHLANLILVARRTDRLEQLKAEIHQTCQVEIELLTADLTNSNSFAGVIEACFNKSGFYGAILNAGMTHLGKHTDLDTKQIQRVIDLNVVSTTQLASTFIQHFEENGAEGRIMVISSLAAHYPTPYQALYSGTKGFITNFINSVALELKNPKLKLSVFSPGGIATEMTEDEGFNDLKAWLMPVEVAAKEASKSFIKGKYNYIPGFPNRLGFAVMKILPLKLISKILGKQYRKSLKL